MNNIQATPQPRSVDRNTAGDSPLALARRTHAAFAPLLSTERATIDHVRQSAEVAGGVVRLAQALGGDIERAPTPGFARHWPDLPYLVRANHCVRRVLAMLAAGTGTRAERLEALQMAYTLLHIDCQRRDISLDEKLEPQAPNLPAAGWSSGRPTLAARDFHERNPARHALRGR